MLSHMDLSASLTVDRAGLDGLLGALKARGYRTIGPVVRDGAVVQQQVSSTGDLPQGWHDEQAPGHYRLHHDDDPSLFAWAVGPESPKSEFYPARSLVWRTSSTGDVVTLEQPQQESAPAALIGSRPCELAAMRVLDRVFAGGEIPDRCYRDRREGSFVVVAECGTPAATCFCTSMGTGPGVEDGYDLALTELASPDGPRYLVRVGSERGAEVVAEMGGSPAQPADFASREAVLENAARRIERKLDAGNVQQLLASNLEHPRWDDVASRCLACGNCTLVCPTCFCGAVSDTTTVDGTVERHRRWDTCFDLAHSLVHTGPVRATTWSRYRQWLTHKLSTWHDQFGTSGCVGCGRCIAWCPVGIDITVEVAAIAASDGAVRVHIESGGDRS
jgi:ferredoxin